MIIRGERIRRAVVPLVFTLLTIIATSDTEDSVINVAYSVNRPFLMNMGERRNVRVTLFTNIEKQFTPRAVKSLRFTFKTSTLSPQFDVLSMNGSSRLLSITRELDASMYAFELELSANYIGHAVLEPHSIEYNDTTQSRYPGKMVKLMVPSIHSLHVIITKSEGVWDTVFIVSVSLFIIITYINLGAQLDTENLRMLVKKPKAIALGFVVTVIVMPLASWFVGKLILDKQVLYRVGSFVFACGPAASASTLWAVMLDSDKELSVGLQVVSTIGALLTMPVLLFLMEYGFNVGGFNRTIKVPYSRLMQTLLVLLIALYVGWRFVGANERSRDISRRIFRPLTFFVLLFIIVFSSVLYWHIYLMFDWKITIASLIITLATYLVSGLLGYLIDFNMDHAVAISIGSTYKNSGIAFAVLLVAFEAPDTYIAYVPCLTQVVTTSLALYLIYCMFKLVNYFRRRGQPAPIRASEGATEADVDQAQARQRSGSDKSQENDEFIAMNVTDLTLAGPPGRKASKLDNEPRSEQTSGG